MIIKKKETIEFSAEELRCVEMTIMLMDGIINEASSPNLKAFADMARVALENVYNYVEGVD